MGKYHWSTELVEQLRQLILNHHNIIILPHTAPDGDALGSTLAWAKVLQAAQPEATIRVLSPDRIENYLNWLPLLDELLIYPDAEEESLRAIHNSDLLFHLDHNQPSRLRYAPLIEAVEQSKAPHILIDHHLDPDPTFTLNISYPEASATCELIHALILSLGWEQHITSEVATLLLYWGSSQIRDASCIATSHQSSSSRLQTF